MARIHHAFHSNPELPKVNRNLTECAVPGPCARCLCVKRILSPPLESIGSQCPESGLPHSCDPLSLVDAAYKTGRTGRRYAAEGFCRSAGVASYRVIATNHTGGQEGTVLQREISSVPLLDKAPIKILQHTG